MADRSREQSVNGEIRSNQTSVETPLIKATLSQPQANLTFAGNGANDDRSQVCAIPCILPTVERSSEPIPHQHEHLFHLVQLDNVAAPMPARGLRT